MAMSLDARTAAAQGGQVWISGDAARADVQTWRARSSAVLTGAGTVRTDDPKLNVRLNYGPWVRQPLRVVLDSELRLSPDAQVFRDGSSLRFAARDAKGGAGLTVERVPRAQGGLDLEAVLKRLAALEINELLLECGATLAGGFLAQGLVDELVLYMAPRFMGEDAAPLARWRLSCAAAEFTRKFAFSDVRCIGDDVRLVLTAREH